MDTKDLYENNKEFRDYLDRYVKKYSNGKPIDIKDAFEHIIVKNVAREYTKDC